MSPNARALSLALTLSLLPTTALAGAWLLPPGDWYTEIRGSHLKADTFRNSDGDRMQLGAVLESRVLSSYSEFGWHPRLGVFIGVPYVNTSLRVTDGGRLPAQAAFGDLALDEGRLPAQTVFGDMILGARFALLSGANALAVNATWKAPAGYNRNLPPVPGTGTQDVAGTLAWGSAIGSRGFVELEGGYNYRFEAPVDQVLASANAGMWFGPLLVGGRYRGAMAMGEGDLPEDEITEHVVGPVFLYRVDDHLDLVAGSLHTALGENVIHANRVYVALTVKQSSLNRVQGFLGSAQNP